jgi:Ni/Co efflux regulator RcnB
MRLFALALLAAATLAAPIAGSTAAPAQWRGGYSDDDDWDDRRRPRRQYREDRAYGEGRGYPQQQYRVERYQQPRGGGPVIGGGQWGGPYGNGPCQGPNGEYLRRPGC